MGAFALFGISLSAISSVCFCDAPAAERPPNAEGRLASGPPLLHVAAAAGDGILRAVRQGRTVSSAGPCAAAYPSAAATASRCCLVALQVTSNNSLFAACCKEGHPGTASSMMLLVFGGGKGLLRCASGSYGWPSSDLSSQMTA